MDVQLIAHPSSTEKILGKENITDIIHVNTTNFDIVKGKTPVTEEKINEIVEYIKHLV